MAGAVRQRRRLAQVRAREPRPEPAAHGLDYVDIFYSHRFDAHTPLEETAGALASAVQQGKALYIGISSYSAAKTREMAELLAQYKVPLLIHQPSYNLLNRWVEHELLGTLDALGTGSIAFTPLAQGLLTSKYLNGVPADARVNKPGGGSLKQDHLSAANLEHVRKLDAIAQRRGQSLAQMALAWVLRGERVTSALIGASRAEQVRENVGALKNLEFSADELAEIDRYATEGGINLWEKAVHRSGDLTGCIGTRYGLRNIGRRIAITARQLRASRCVAAMQRREPRMGVSLQQRRQPFDQQYRDADAEDHAQHAQQVVAELRGARHRAEKQRAGQRHRNQQDEVADREIGGHACLRSRPAQARACTGPMPGISNVGPTRSQAGRTIRV